MSDYNNTSELARLQFVKKLHEYGELSERDQAALFAQCVQTQVLKAPATAVFPDLDEMVVNGSNGHYSVSGFVDAQNGYGAMVRSTYSYNVEIDANGNWKCTDQFVDSSAAISQQINGQMTANTILWWILGIIGTAITFGITSCQMSSLF